MECVCGGAKGGQTEVVEEEERKGRNALAVRGQMRIGLKEVEEAISGISECWNGKSVR